MKAWEEHGMQGATTAVTLRDYFAAKAMQGFLASKDRPTLFHPEQDAEYCYRIADAMLKERAK